VILGTLYSPSKFDRVSEEHLAFILGGGGLKLKRSKKLPSVSFGRCLRNRLLSGSSKKLTVR
jgi:hypothetical protein